MVDDDGSPAPDDALTRDPGLEGDLAQVGEWLRQEIVALRGQLQREVARVGDRLEERVAQLEARIDRRESTHERRSTEIDAVIDDHLEGLARSSLAIERATVRELPQRVEELDRSLAAIEGLVDRLYDTGEGFIASTSEAAGTVGRVSEQVEVSTEQLAALLATLEHHREALTLQFAGDRRQLIDDVVSRLVADLPKRARRRLAAELAAVASRQAERRPSVPAPRRPALADEELEVEEPPEPDVVDLDDLDDLDDADDVDDEEYYDDPEAAREELIDVVMEVKGIGATRAEMLADAFGALGYLEEATEDDVVALTGMPAAVARAVLEHVGARA